MDYFADYRSKLRTAEEAVKIIKSGDWVDYGTNIGFPKLLDAGKRLFAHEFNGYWRDVGTIASYHETSMDLLGEHPAFDIYASEFPIMSNASIRPPHYIGPDGSVSDSLVSNGCEVLGTVRHSILSTDAHVGARAVVEDSILLPGACVKEGAHVVRAILGEGAVVEEGVSLGSVDAAKDTVVIGDGVTVGKGDESNA